MGKLRTILIGVAVLSGFMSAMLFVGSLLIVVPAAVNNDFGPVLMGFTGAWRLAVLWLLAEVAISATPPRA